MQKMSVFLAASFFSNMTRRCFDSLINETNKACHYFMLISTVYVLGRLKKLAMYLWSLLVEILLK